MELIVSLSALPPSLYRQYRKGWKPNPVLLHLFEKLSGKKGTKAMRIYIDAKTDAVIKNITQAVKPPKEVVDALAQKKIEIVDYVAGTGKDEHGRVVRIGRALKDPSVKKAFDSDPGRKSLVNATRSHQLICISMHPYDIAGMSTDRGWSSCMNLKTGSNRRFIKQDVANGTLIAYLIDAQDKNINKPVARALAKPYFQHDEHGEVAKKHQVVGANVNAMYLVDYAYPDSTMPFVHVLQNWFDQHINPHLAVTERNGMYTMHERLYRDKRDPDFDYDLEKDLTAGNLDNVIKSIIEGTRGKMESRDLAVSTVSRYPEVAAKLYAAGYHDSRFLARAQKNLVRANQTQGLQALWRGMIKDAEAIDDDFFAEILDQLTSSPQLFLTFVDCLPANKQNAAIKYILNIYSVYKNGREDFVDSGFAGAVQSIWNVTSRLPDPEKEFWRAVSAINDDALGYMTFKDEYGFDSDYYETTCIGLALGSLALDKGRVPANNLESLQRNKKAVPKSFYDAAVLYFNGGKCVTLSAYSAQDKMRDMFLAETGVSKFYAADSVRALDLTDLTHKAFDATGFKMLKNFAPRADDLIIMVDSPLSEKEIKAKFEEALLSLAMPLLREELEVDKEKFAKGVRRSYDPYDTSDDEEEQDEYIGGDEDFDEDDEDDEEDDIPVVRSTM